MTSNIKCKSRLGFAIKFSISICLFFTTMEMSARIDDHIKYNAPFFENYSSDLLRKFDSNEIPFNVPNAKYEKWENNNSGFRGKIISIVKPANTNRIVCMGII